MFLALTIDIDPDANIPHPDNLHTISAGDDRIYVDACRRGLSQLERILHRYSIPATLFWEARTLRVLHHTHPSLVDALLHNTQLEHACHAYRHEDLAGRYNSRRPNAQTLNDIITEATDIIRHITHHSPIGFRAPYCNFPNKAIPVLSRLEYEYDASKTCEPNHTWALEPYNLACETTSQTVAELALSKTYDEKGDPISGYLWQLCEGKRCVSDYSQTIHRLASTFPSGLYQLALHPWHLVKDANGEYHKNPKANIEKVSNLLCDINDSVIKWVTLQNYLELQDCVI